VGYMTDNTNNLIFYMIYFTQWSNNYYKVI
jgi:hypothetical protein